MNSHSPSRNLAMLLAPADLRLLDEVRARRQHPYAHVKRWQVARLLAIIDSLASELDAAQEALLKNEFAVALIQQPAIHKPYPASPTMPLREMDTAWGKVPS